MAAARNLSTWLPCAEDDWASGLCRVGGGYCLQEDASTAAQQQCVCPTGFGPDASFYHPTLLDCSKPTSAYIGMMVFQTLTTWVVCYKLYTQSLRSKGMLKHITWNWIATMVCIWAFSLSLAAQDGFYEAGSVTFALAAASCGNAGFLVLRLLVEARYAVEMRSVSRTLRIMRACKLVMFTIIAACGTSLLVTSTWSHEDDDSHAFNICMHVFTWVLSGIIVAVASSIVYHDVKFASSLRRMIRENNAHHGADGAMGAAGRDEKPDLIKRLVLFKEMVLLLTLSITPGLASVFVLFMVLGCVPFLWLFLTFIFQTFSIVGVKLESLNKMIQSFQDAKQADSQLQQSSKHHQHNNTATSDGNSSSTSTTTSWVNWTEDAVPMFKRSRFLFYVKPRVLKVGKDTLVWYVCGARAAKWMAHVTAKQGWFLLSSCVLGVFTVTYCWVVLLVPVDEQDDGGGALSLAFVVIGLGLAVPMVGLMLMSLVSVTFLIRHLALRSAAFQFRTLVACLTLAANLQVLQLPIDYARAVAVVLLFFSTLFALIWDSLGEVKGAYVYAAAALSASVPFLGWFLLAFDYWDSRRNSVYFGFYSSFHFAADMNLIMLACIAGDGSRVMKFGASVFIYVHAEMKTRYLQLGDWPEDAMRWGETDLAEPDAVALEQQKQQLQALQQQQQPQPLFAVSPGRASLAVSQAASTQHRNTLVVGSPSILGMVTGKKKDKKESKDKNTPTSRRVQRVLYISLLILESDSLLYTWCTGRDKARTERWLAWSRQHKHAVALATGLSIGAPLTLWAGFVLTGLVPDELAFLCLVGFPALAYRAVFKSSEVLRFLVTQPEFWVDLAMCVVGLVFLGQALGGFTVRTAAPLLLAAGVFVEYRLSDALVNMDALTPYHPLVFFPCVAPVLFLVPIVGNINRIVDLNTESFALVPMHSSEVTGDVFLLTNNPPQGTFQRIRFSQLAFDLFFAFGVKLLLDFAERWVVTHPGALTFIVSPVRPKFTTNVTGQHVEDFDHLVKQHQEQQDQLQALQQPTPQYRVAPQLSNLSLADVRIPEEEAETDYNNNNSNANVGGERRSKRDSQLAAAEGGEEV